MRDKTKEYETVMRMRQEGATYLEIMKKVDLPKTTIANWTKGRSRPYSIWNEEEFRAFQLNKAVRGKDHPCYGLKGELSYNYGKKRSEETKEKLSESKLGSRNPMWKGDNASINAARQRAIRLHGHLCPEGCEIHHKDGDPFNNDPNNIEFVTRRQHMEQDGRLDKLIHRGKNR